MSTFLTLDDNGGELLLEDSYWLLLDEAAAVHRDFLVPVWGPNVGSSSTPDFSFRGDGTTGIYSPSAGKVGVAGTQLVTPTVMPAADNSYDIGDPSLNVRHVYANRYYNPAICSVKQAGAAQTIANGSTGVAITWDTDLYDPLNMHNTSTNTDRITIPTGYGGTYQVCISYGFASNAVGRRGLYVGLNSSTSIWAQSGAQVLPAYSGASMRLSTSTICTLAAGDYVRAICFQESGGNLAGVADNCSMSVARLGDS